MPAVRFMRKSRAIESQHGSDLSRVGRNDTAKERRGEVRDEELLDGEWFEKEVEKRNNRMSNDRQQILNCEYREILATT